MTEIRKAYLPGPFGQVHIYDTGPGEAGQGGAEQGPVLILAHQSPVCARTFEAAMPLLAAAGLRVIAVDTPGYGNSDIPASPPELSDYAGAFIAVLDGLGLARAHFLGHHTGAAIVCNLAARYPDRVDKLILHGPPLLSPKELAHFQALELVPLPVHADGSHLKEAWDRRLQFTPGWSNLEAMHRRLIDQLWAGDTWWYGHRAAFHYDMEPDLMALRGPVLVLSNTGDDLHACAQKARALRPEFAYTELTGGTHDIVDEQPAAWSRAVAGFIHGR